MIEWFSNEQAIPRAIKKFRQEYPLLLDLRNVEQQSNAIYKGVLSLISVKGGYDFDTNRSIADKKYVKDHIFPRAVFSKHDNINSIPNMTWSTTDTNQRIKRARPPSTFFE